MIVTFGVLEEIIASSKNKFRIKMLCVTASLICFAFTCVTCREYNVTSESLESANVNEFNLLNIKLSSKIEDIARLYRLESGRGNKLMKVSVPLIVGFKLTGFIISAVTAITIFLLQSLFISKMAFLVSFILVAKVVFDNMKKSSFKFTGVETGGAVDYIPYSNSYLDYQEHPEVGLDYSQFHNHGNEELETLHSNNFLSIVQPKLNLSSPIVRRAQDDFLQNEQTSTSIPVVIGYNTYVKRIIKEVTN